MPCSSFGKPAKSLAGGILIAPLTWPILYSSGSRTSTIILFVIALYFLRRDRMPCTEGLIALSVRWMHPIQQQGRRSPRASLSSATAIRLARVSGFLASSIQQINSLRASGVISSHCARMVGLAASASCRSFGALWTVPSDIFIYLVYYVRLADGLVGVPRSIFVKQLSISHEHFAIK